LEYVISLVKGGGVAHKAKQEHPMVNPSREEEPIEEEKK
jgi:hypothetical protein